METAGSFLKGQFLIAMPGLLDPNFSQTVTCMTEHNENGAVGVVVNRSHTTLTCGDIFRELQINTDARVEQTPIFIGGPVHIDEIFVLHGPPFDWEASLRVTSFLALTNTRDILEAIASGGGPEKFQVTLGCAGWGPGQLEYEIRENAWLTCPADEEIIFQKSAEAKWEAAVKKMGIDLSLLSSTAGHA